MCGISCVVHIGKASCEKGARPDHPAGDNDAIETELVASLNYIQHRGPDSKGIWVSIDGIVGLGHCRLAINDLRPSASQPLHSPGDNAIHAVVNGEIYDFDRIRGELASEYEFNTGSDSEVVVALYKRYGMPAFLDYLRGEFALCIYDERTRQFIAARDRYGIKPLFWTRSGGKLLVAAEVKAFLGLGWKAEWDVKSIAEAGWNFDDRTLFKGVQKVAPGHYLTCDVDSGAIEMGQYWDMNYPDKHEVEKRTEETMVKGVRERLVEAVRLRLRADVPVGIYLSGGIDSSVLAGIATHLVKREGLSMGTKDASHRICCFSIAFDEESGFDESSVSERTAEWLGVKFIKKLMDEEELSKRFEDATWHCEQHNHGDLNFVGKFALSEVVRESGYKVVLTGEGADENFAGYPVYLPDYLRERDYAWPQLEMDDAQRKKRCIEADEDVGHYYESVGADGSNRGTDEASHMLGGISTPASMCAFHFDSFAPWVKQLKPRSARSAIAHGIDSAVRPKMKSNWHPLHAALYTWSKGHLANGFLSYLGDRTEMAHSVEARPPFLDHKLTEYINNLPPSVKIRYDAASDNFVEKWIQREAAKPYITKELYQRKKHPYSAPTTYPTDGSMHKLFRRLCSEDNIRKLGFVDIEATKDLVKQAFEEKNAKAMRTCFVIGQWVVLAERFSMMPATLENAC